MSFLCTITQFDTKFFLCISSLHFDFFVLIFYFSLRFFCPAFFVVRRSSVENDFFVAALTFNVAVVGRMRTTMTTRKWNCDVWLLIFRTFCNTTTFSFFQRLWVTFFGIPLNSFRSILCVQTVERKQTNRLYRAKCAFIGGSETVLRQGKKKTSVKIMLLNIRNHHLRADLLAAKMVSYCRVCCTRFACHFVFAVFFLFRPLVFYSFAFIVRFPFDPVVVVAHVLFRFFVFERTNDWTNGRQCTQRRRIN